MKLGAAIVQQPAAIMKLRTASYKAKQWQPSLLGTN
jgi:hypothetical protein